MLIFKIVPELEWIAAERAGVYEGSAHDRRDGFLHFSSASQLRGTLEKHYADVTGALVIVAVESDALGPALKWDVSRGSEKFPHLYGPLLVSQVVSTITTSFGRLAQSGFAELGKFDEASARA